MAELVKLPSAIHHCYMNIFVQYIEFFVQTAYNISEKERDIMAKSNTSNISIRMDSNLKAATEELLNGEVLWK